MEAAAEFSSGEPSENELSLSSAISAVLGEIMPARTLASPFVRVSLGASHVMAAILTFAALPKTATDRSLVITQRFCREHRFEPGSIAVVSSHPGNSKAGASNVLCFAAEQMLLTGIAKALSEMGLHPDIIAPDYLLSFAGANSREIETPGIAVLREGGRKTILVWDKQGVIVHIAVVQQAGGDDEEAKWRLTAKLRRYAQVVATQDAPVAVYADDSFEDDIAPGSVQPALGLKLLPWPAAGRSPDRIQTAPKL